MKKYSFLIVLFLMSFALSAQNQAQQGSKLSALNTSGFTQKQLLTLDSIKMPKLSTTDFAPKSFRIETDTIVLVSYMNPIKAELIKDAPAYTEHITWDIYNVVAIGKEEVKALKAKEAEQRKENVKKLLEEADRLKAEAEKLAKGQ